MAGHWLVVLPESKGVRHDPGGQEGPPGSSSGLGLLAVAATHESDKMHPRARGF